MSGEFQVKRPVDGEIHVELSGRLDAEVVEALERALRHEVEAQPVGSCAVVLFTGQVTDCSMNARPGLVKVQQLLARFARRTVYLDDRPRFRGLALWVVHVAEDRHAKAVATPEAVRYWLDSQVERIHDAQARAEGNA